jgi:Asp-tRNA(Asn)/Glu-tRNA(Gln) amidotransferase C subunit
MSHSVRVENITREDKERELKCDSDKLLDLVPDKKERHLKVKSIF